MHMKCFFLFSLPFSFAFASCHFVSEGVRGNGNIETESRSAGSFTSVSVSGNIDLYITQGAARDVRIETDENLLGLIEVVVDGDELRIRPSEHRSLNPSRDIKVYVSNQVFKRLKASGACNIYSESKIVSTEMLDINLSGASHANIELNAPVIETKLSGAGSIELKGETKDLRINGSGNSEIRCYELKAENVEVDISGAGEAEVFASMKLDVHISGAASVTYRGNAMVNQRVSGAGSVRKVQ